MTKLLFIGSATKLRSPTAETIFSEYEGIQAISAGTNADAETAVSGDLIEWADIIFAMETSHRNKVATKYNTLLKNKKLVCLDIPDNHDYMQAELVELIRARVQKHIRV